MECASLNPVFSLCGNKRNNPTAPKITDNSTTAALKSTSYPDYLAFYCWFGFSVLGAGSWSVKHPPLGLGGGGIQQSWDKEKGAGILGETCEICWLLAALFHSEDNGRGMERILHCIKLHCTGLH